MVFGGDFWLDGLWLCWIHSQHHPCRALSLYLLVFVSYSSFISVSLLCFWCM